MKSIETQISFLDCVLLPIYGFQSIVDYQYILTLDYLEQTPNLLDRLNQVLPQIRQYFPVKQFNLHKTQYRIQTITQAFNLLRQCLEIATIPFVRGKQCINRKKIKFLRLSSQNFILQHYIEQMSGKRTFSTTQKNEQFQQSFCDTKKDPIIMKNDVTSGRPKLNYEQVMSMVSGTTTETYRIPFVSYLNNNKFTLSRRSSPFLHKNLSQIKIQFTDSCAKPVFLKARYSLYGGGCLLYNDSLSDNQSLIPSENLLLTPYCLYHEIYLEILFDWSTEVVNLIEQNPELQLIITVTYLSFNQKNHQTLLHSLLDFVDWSINHGMIATPLFLRKDRAIHHILPNETMGKTVERIDKEDDSQITIESKIITMGVYHVMQCTSNEAFSKLIQHKDVDATFYRNNITIVNPIIYIDSNNHTHYYLTLLKSADTLTNFKLEVTHPCVAYLTFEDRWNVQFSADPNNLLCLTTLTGTDQIKCMCYADWQIHFVDLPSNTKIRLSYDSYFWEPMTKNRLFQSNDVIFHLTDDRSIASSSD